MTSQLGAASSAGAAQGAKQEAISLYDAGEYQAALDAFLALSTDASNDADARYYIGLCCAALGRFEDAMVYLEQVVLDHTSDDRVRQCQLLLSVMYALSGRSDMGQDTVAELLKAGYRPASVYCTAAFMAYDDRNASKAIEYYEKALQADEKCVTALNGLGYVLANEGRDLTRALQCCQQAVGFAPTSANLDSLGTVYIKLGMKDQAKEYLTRALNMANPAQRPIIKEHLKVCNAPREAAS